MDVKYCSDPSAILEFDRLMYTGLDFLQRLAPVSQRGLKFFDSQFDSVAWRCLTLYRDAEAMRIAVVVGKEKIGPVNR